MLRGLGPVTIIRSGCAVIEASIRIRVQRFDRVAAWAVGASRRNWHGDGSSADDRRAVLAWCRRVPWRALCMEQGVALARLLSKRGEPVTIFYGAVTQHDNLEAHVWVRSGDIPIVGCEIADQFIVLSRISNVLPSSSIHSSLYKERNQGELR